MWFWEERNRFAGPPWEKRVICLGLEPATASTGEGLGAAVARGEARVLEPMEEIVYWVELEVHLFTAASKSLAPDVLDVFPPRRERLPL